MKKFFCFTVLVLLHGIVAFIAIKYHNEPSIVITEVCPHNDTVIYNSTGLYNDYVELYNNSSVSLDLGEFYLSDKDTVTDFHNLKSEILKPGQYTVVFINKSFSLSDEETLYLFDSFGKIVDSVEIGIVETDKVYARDLATMQWKENMRPSPGQENIFEEFEKVEAPEEIFPVFNVEPGFYDEAFYLEMNVEGNYKIYYTLDGSKPDENAILYKEPIYIAEVTENENVYSAIEEISVLENAVVVPNYQVDKCNVIRAVAIGEDGAISKETVGSYFINYNGRVEYEDVYVLALTTDPENLFSKEKGIYVTGRLGDEQWYPLENKENVYTAIVNYTRSGNGWRRPAAVELFDKEGMRLYNQNVQIGIHGGWSTAFAQKGFNLLPADKSNEKGYVFSDLIFGGGKNSNTSLMLRPGGFRDWRVTKFRDVLNHALVEDRAVTILRSVPCQVFIDGEYWGLYNLQERIDQGLIAKNFGVREEDVIVLKNKNVVGGDDELYRLYSEVEQYAKENDLSLEENYDHMERLIDIQSYIDYYCFQIYVANCDSIANNYSCWRTLTVSDEPYYDGKWRWILYDTDDSLGMVEDLAEPDTDSFREGHWSVAPMDDPLFTSLIKNEEFKKRFVETFIEMADSNFEYEHVNAVIDELSEQYMQPTILSCKRFEGIDLSEEEYMERVEVIRDFFAKRRNYIIGHMESSLGVKLPVDIISNK